MAVPAVIAAPGARLHCDGGAAGGWRQSVPVALAGSLSAKGGPLRRRSRRILEFRIYYGGRGLSKGVDFLGSG